MSMAIGGGKHRTIRWQRLVPHCPALRLATSALITASAFLYLTAAVDGVVGLASPPPDIVTSGLQDMPAQHDVSLLLYPLTFAGAAIAGLLLLWSGCLGLRSFRTQPAWRRPQIIALAAYGVGAVAFTIGLLSSDGGGLNHYIDEAWHGLNPLQPSLVLTLLIVMVTLLAPMPPEEDEL
ncbi:hypothetical protein J4573_06090 [Actinomadura barringtoniae]|uniref:Uncharacterized protein n=1 Tax=Actinomadura barringtoniae TaxID=1427535 RepID=A0A939P722_9ACTN|nr:hypothetical protein [Actinomadura barringtoniae]MBO2446653.1 hypothetical protein [Actinomadura barringtoniae]